MQTTSIIIPTYNDKDHIKILLSSLNNHLAKQLNDIEIIIINNGSSDITADEAKKFNANAYHINKTTVSSARNYGASIAKNEILVFLDADMEITNTWADELLNVVISLQNDPFQIIGNKVSIPTTPNWIEYYWFFENPDQNINYINSANLIISRNLFNDLSGFDELLISGEDYDLSMRALKLGARLIKNNNLRAIHHGYPKNIYAFVKREIWHGTSDFINIQSIIKSKVALATLVYIILHITTVASCFFNTSISFLTALLIFSLLLLLSIKKSPRMKPKHILINTTIYYLYFFGRSISLLKTTFMLKQVKNRPEKYDKKN